MGRFVLLWWLRRLHFTPLKLLNLSCLPNFPSVAPCQAFSQHCQPFQAGVRAGPAQKLSVLGRLHHQPSVGSGESPRAPNPEIFFISIPYCATKAQETWAALGTEAPRHLWALKTLWSSREKGGRDLPYLPSIPLLSASCLGLKGFLQPKFLGDKGGLSPHSPCPPPQAATWPEQTLLEEDEDGGGGKHLCLGIQNNFCSASSGVDRQGDTGQAVCPQPCRAVPGWHSSRS